MTCKFFKKGITRMLACMMIVSSIPSSSVYAEAVEGDGSTLGNNEVITASDNTKDENTSGGPQEESEDQPSQLYEGTVEMLGEEASLNISAPEEAISDNVETAVEDGNVEDVEPIISDNTENEQEIIKVIDVSFTSVDGEATSLEQGVQVSLTTPDAIDHIENPVVYKISKEEAETEDSVDKAEEDGCEADSEEGDESSEEIIVLDKADISEAADESEVMESTEEVDSSEGSDSIKEIECHSDFMEEGVTNETLSFEIEESATYVLTGHVVEKTILTSDGEDYKIEIEYGENAGIPEGAKLEVVEIPSDEGEDYLAKTANLLSCDSDLIPYARLFDITILDSDGEKIEPAAAVSEKITVDDKDELQESDIQVVHFAEEPEIIDAFIDSKEISFETASFSVYAVVEAPPRPVPERQSNIPLEELELRGYNLSVKKKNSSKTYYFRNIISGGTKIAKTTDVNLAALWYFEKADGDNNYHLYFLIFNKHWYGHGARNQPKGKNEMGLFSQK